MTYRQKDALDPRSLRGPLARLLELDLRRVDAQYRATGYSGSVYRLVLHDARGRRHAVILKPARRPHEFEFYRDVLEPCSLDSPHVFGTIDVEDRTWTVLEYVPHEAPDWGDPHKFRRAVDWLLFKDQVVQAHLDRIRALGCVRDFQAAGARDRLEPLRRGADERVDPRLSRAFVERLERRADRIEQLSRLLRRGDQTVTHNDFQMLNILFATGERRGRMFVIDWTDPAVGSVCVDLATLVHVAPEDLRGELTARYRAGRFFDAFDETFAAARAHVNLSILTWMIDAIRDGQAGAVSLPDFHRTVDELVEYTKP